MPIKESIIELDDAYPKEITNRLCWKEESNSFVLN